VLEGGAEAQDGQPIPPIGRLEVIGHRHAGKEAVNVSDEHLSPLLAIAAEQICDRKALEVPNAPLQLRLAVADAPQDAVGTQSECGYHRFDCVSRV
jgi:hypothetical protein